MFSQLFNRNSRRTLLIEFNPYQVLAAGITRPHRGPVTVDCAEEFERHDTAALRQWIEENLDKRKTWMAAYCSLVPRRGIMQRETLHPRRLAEREVSRRSRPSGRHRGARCDKPRAGARSDPRSR